MENTLEKQKFELLKSLRTSLECTQEQFDSYIAAQGETGLTRDFEAERKAFLNTLLANPGVTVSHIQNCSERLHKTFLDIAKLGLSLVKDSGISFAYLTVSGQGFHIFSSYNGLIRLAVLGGTVRVTTADTVHENDDVFRTFAREDGTREVQHEYGKAVLASGRGHLIGAYCVTTYNNGIQTASVLSSEELQRIRCMTDSAFWQNFPEAMCKKTAVRAEAKNWIRFGQNNRLLSQLLSHEESLSEHEFPNNPLRTQPLATTQDQQAPKHKKSMSGMTS